MEKKMTEPAKVTRIPSDVYSVDIPKFQPISSLIVNGTEMGDYFSNASFSAKNLKLHQFAKSLTVDHAAYYEMNKEILDRDYQTFYNGLVDNCKAIYIQDPQFNVFYDAMRHQDTISWRVMVGSEQIDFFKDLFVGPPEIREVEKRVYIPVYPNTLRECFKRAWVLIKNRFKK
jgi:hypothetical protein